MGRALRVHSFHCSALPPPPCRRPRRAIGGLRVCRAGPEVTSHPPPAVPPPCRGLPGTVVDAYLSPVLRRYVEQVASQVGGAPLFFMQSNGGLTDCRTFQGKDSILSGPAGGIVGAVQVAPNQTPLTLGFHRMRRRTDWIDW